MIQRVLIAAALFAADILFLNVGLSWLLNTNDSLLVFLAPIAIAGAILGNVFVFNRFIKGNTNAEQNS